MATVDDLTFTLSDDKTYYSVKATSTFISGELEIPSTYNELPVKSIDEYGFSNCSKLTSITIPDSITSIGSWAFFYCSNLASITLSNSVTSIGSGVFYHCLGLTSITIPDSVTSIGSDAFYCCSSLTSITIPASVTSIGNCAFWRCPSLTSIIVATENTVYHSKNNCCIETSTNKLIFGCKNSTIPDYVTAIDSFAFYRCSSLTSITIPASVTSIGEYAFYNCSNLSYFKFEGNSILESSNVFSNTPLLTKIWVNNDSTGWGSAWGGKTIDVDYEDFTFTLSGDKTYYSVKAKSTSISGELEIPSTYSGLPVKSIDARGFYTCSKLTSITIPDSVTSIGDSAFNRCLNLTSITVPDSVTSIGVSAFDFCSNLTSITIPDGVTSIGDGAFSGCTGLTSITIPDRVTSIGSRAFWNCSGLTSITIPDSVTSIGSGAFRSCSGLTSITVADGNTAYHSKNDCCIETATNKLIFGCKNSVIPDYVTSIGDDAFSGCTGLTGITIPDSVTSIGDSAFSSCSGLTNITIPDSVTSIGDSAFNFCSNLISITIPDGVTSIGEYAFYNCSNLTSITIPASVTSIGKYAFEDCSSLTGIIIPAGVTSIGNSAFKDCSGLSYFKFEGNSIPESSNIFSNTPLLTKICINDDSTGWGSTWGGKTVVVDLTFTLSSDKTYYSVEAKNQSISGFLIISPTHNGLPVKSISDGAFEECSSLTSITIPDSVTSIGEYAFYNCSNLTSITIPSGATSIGDNTFDGCSGLTNITIPDGVTSIGDLAFSGCSGLTNITIPASVTTISYDAFSRCSSLTKITIPDSVTSIGHGAFCDCSSLSYFKFEGNSISESLNVFSNTPLLTNIRINADSTGWGSTWGGKPVVVDDPVYDYLVFTLSSDRTYYVVKAKNTDISGALEIPAEYGDIPVKEIAEHGFYKCNKLTSITLPEILTNIGYYAFSGCTSLTSISLPDGLMNISSGVFSGCSSVKSIILPAALTDIGNYAFNGCSSLVSIIIPTLVTDIGMSAFENCSSLTSITIPVNVNSIGVRAFRSCNNIETINVDSANTTYHSEENCCIETTTNTLVFGCKNSVIPSYVRNIGNYAFSGIELTSISLPEGLTSIGNNAFSYCPSITSIMIPASVTSIENGAFSHCSSLKTISLPEGLTNIDNTTFAQCTSLSSISIPSSVTSIGGMAFYYCFALATITIPASVTSIDTAAFAGCSSLRSFKFEGNAIAEANEVLGYTPKLTSVRINATSSGFGSTWGGKPIYIDGLSFILNSDKKSYTVLAEMDTLLEGNINIPSEYNNLPVTNIADRGFHSDDYQTSGITGFSIPDSITSIGYEAFKKCESLTSISFPKSLSKLGISACEDCLALTSVVFDSASPITSIEHCAFKNCSSLTSVVLPDSLTGIGNSSFQGCSKLTSINIPSKIISIGDSAFYNCLSLKSVTIPATTNYIGNYAFYKCGQLNKFKLEGDFIPENRKVLFGTTGLSAVSVNAEKSGWSKTWNNKPVELEYSDYLEFVLNSDKASYSVRAASNKVLPDSVEIPATYNELPVTTIASNAFYQRNNFTSISIPNSVTTIGYDAFNECTKLVSVTIPDSVTAIDSFAFYCCSSLTSITIPSSVTSIGRYAFSYSGLTEITIPETVTTIDPVGVFCNCSALVSAALPSTLTEIGLFFFENCSNLTTVNIPDSVTKIGKRAFYGCKNLLLEKLPSSLITIEDEAFDSPAHSLQVKVVNSGVLTIPDKVTKIGAGAFGACCGVHKVIIPSSVIEIGDEAFYNFGFDVDRDEHKRVFYLKGNFISEASKVFANVSSIDYLVVNKGTTGWGDTWNGVEVTVFDAANPLSYSYAPHDTEQNVYVRASVPVISGAITIPSTYDGGPVRYVDGFEDCEELTKVTLPSSITKIYSGAFRNCSKLASINIPNTAVISDRAFWGCSSLTSITIPTSNTAIPDYAFTDCSSLKSISIPSSITWIGAGAFSGCSSLTSVTIPNKVTTINDYAFASCTNLATVTIGSAVRYIGASAFYYTAISAITIPSSVILIGGTDDFDFSTGSVFGRCNNLKTITVNSSNSVYKSEGNCIINRSTNELICGCKTSVIPSTVTSIGKQAFYFCENLTSITIPSSVTKIEAQAFRGCSSLTSVTIPSSVTTINSDNVFTKCTNLSFFKFEGNYITYTEKTDVFKDTPNLKYVLIKPHTSNWGSSWEYKPVYYDWNDCLTFTLNSEGTEYSVRTRNDINTSGGTILIPETYNSLPVTSLLPPTALAGNKWLTSIIIPDSITNIGNSAFYYCTNLTSIDIPDSVSSIGNNAFEGCTNLTSIKLSNSLTAISRATFVFCYSLTSITIPDSVQYIDGSAFKYCSALSSIEIGKSVSFIGIDAFGYCEKLTSVVLPESLTLIGSNAFSNCSNLISLEFKGDKPSGVDITNCDKFEYFIVPVGSTGWGTTYQDKPVRYKSGGYGAIQNISLTNSLVNGPTSIMRTFLGEDIIQP